MVPMNNAVHTFLLFSYLQPNVQSVIARRIFEPFEIIKQILNLFSTRSSGTFHIWLINTCKYIFSYLNTISVVKWRTSVRKNRDPKCPSNGARIRSHCRLTNIWNNNKIFLQGVTAMQKCVRQRNQIRKGQLCSASSPYYIYLTEGMRFGKKWRLLEFTKIAVPVPS